MRFVTEVVQAASLFFYWEASLAPPSRMFHPRPWAGKQFHGAIRLHSLLLALCRPFPSALVDLQGYLLLLGHP